MHIRELPVKVKYSFIIYSLQMERYKLLKAQILNMTGVLDSKLEDADLSSIAKRTEGYVARDLHMLLQRAVHAHRVTHPGK